MWASITGLISAVFTGLKVLRALIDLWNTFKQFQRDQAKKKADENRADREKAAEDIRNAQTEEEFDEASDRLHDRSGRK